jgi:hypothetical protein
MNFSKMSNRKSRSFYLLSAGACLLGYSWLMFVLFSYGNTNSTDIKVCIFRNITGIPCPACGSSRAIVSLIHGNIVSSLLTNPFGIIIATVMLVLPFWLIYDFISMEKTLYFFFQKTNHFLGKKTIVIILVVVVLANWVWNIFKFCLL